MFDPNKISHTELLCAEELEACSAVAICSRMF